MRNNNGQLRTIYDIKGAVYNNLDIDDISRQKLPPMQIFSAAGPTGVWAKKMGSPEAGKVIQMPPVMNQVRPKFDVYKWGKRRIVKRLGLIQSAHDKQGQTFELQGFDRLPVGFGNADSSTELQNPNYQIGDWGSIFSKLSEWGTSYLETEKAKAEAKKLEAEAAAAGAVTTMQQAKMGMPGLNSTTLLILAAIIGGIFLFKKK